MYDANPQFTHNAIGCLLRMQSYLVGEARNVKRLGILCEGLDGWTSVSHAQCCARIVFGDASLKFSAN